MFCPQTVVKLFDEQVPQVAGDLVKLARLHRASDLQQRASLIQKAACGLARGMIGDVPELWQGWLQLASCTED